MTALRAPSSVRPPSRSAPACLYCGGRDLVVAYTGVRDRLGYVPGEREFWKCRACASLVLVPLPKTEELAGFYPTVYSFRIDKGASALRRWLARAEHACFYQPQYAAQVRAILREVRSSPPIGRSLLDVGCGPGLRLLEFRRQGWDVRGFDLQPSVVDYLQSSLRIPADCGDIGELSEVYPANSFDLATCFFMVEHIPDVAAALAAFHRVLRPGGWMAVVVPLADSLQTRMLGARWSAVTEAPRHLSLPSQTGLLRATERAGFHDARLIADASLSCTASLSLSLIPAGNLSRASARGAIRGTLARVIAGTAAFAALPWVWAENHLFRRPAHGIIVARKDG